MREFGTFPGYHLNINTVDTSKTVRINSRTYTVAGTIIGAQVKPRAGVNVTGDITGLEVMPGIGVASVTNTASIIGVNSNPYLHATAGAVTGDIRAFSAMLEKPTGAGTVTGSMSCLKCYNNTNTTVTGGVYALDIAAHGGNNVWTAFARFGDADGLASVTNGSILNDISATANAGWIKVIVGTTVRYIALYAAKT
jgi:hypothetical protein